MLPRIVSIRRILLGSLLAASCFAQQSYVAVPHAVVKALQGLEAREGDLTIKSGTPLDALYPTLKKQTAVPFIEGIASFGAAQGSDAFLKERGFAATGWKLEPNEVALVGVVDIRVKWPKNGTVRDVKLVSLRKVPGVDLPCNGYEVEGKPVLELATENGFSVFLTIPDRKVANDGTALFQYVTALSAKKTPGQQYHRVHFPMISLKQETKQEAIVGAVITGAKTSAPWRIKEAVIEASLSLDERGAMARAAAKVRAVTFGVTRNDESDLFEIDRDFIIWFEKQGVCYFAAYISEDCMRSPVPDGQIFGKQ